MTRRALLATALLAALLSGCTSPEEDAADTTETKLPPVKRVPRPGAKAPQWVEWSDDIFERARKENKLVLLDLGAVWCHWCHVMDDKTYSNPDIIGLLNANFITVRVDQDSRPDLAARYERWGWPATILFDANGTELAKLSGFIAAPRFAFLLEAFVRDPTPGPSARAAPRPSAASSSLLDEAMKSQMEELFTIAYEKKYGGWGTTHKFLDWSCVEYALERARRFGDKESDAMARETLDKQFQLLDPVWGGVYQYSHYGEPEKDKRDPWTNPHYEKLLRFQAENLRLYAFASVLYNEPRYLEAARSIDRYVQDFLTSEDGVFYPTQDADLVQGEHSEGYFALDDKARRAQGIPRIDKKVYSRDNGWYIRGLCALFQVTGDDAVLARAEKAARWILANRALGKGGFRHDEVDKTGPYLVDTLNMGDAFLSLAVCTDRKEWIDRAAAAAAFIEENFKSEVGFTTEATAKGDGVFAQPIVNRGENLCLARFSNQLHEITGDKRQRAMAEHAMRFLTHPSQALRQRTAETLLTDLELGGKAPHITIVGAREDPAVQALIKAALRFPAQYKTVEVYDPKTQKASRTGLSFPDLGKAAAFACSGDRCSSPVTDPTKLFDALASLGYKAKIE